MSSSEVLILYGSQTGQAEAISQEIADRLTGADVSYHYACMDEATDDPVQFLSARPLVVVVLSSTGDGDAPDNASKFLRRLNNQELPADALSGLRFALLGLGDSNYSTFHGCPKKFERRLGELGAAAFFPSGWADDAVELETAAEPWMEALLPALRKARNAPASHAFTSAATSATDLAGSLAEISISKAKLSPVQTAVDFPKDGPCLVRGAPSLTSDAALRVPILSPAFLHALLTGQRMSDEAAAAIPWQNGSEFPGSAGGLRGVDLVALKQLTQPGATLAKFEMTLDTGPKEEPLQELSIDNYEPGDSFYFLAPNPAPEVDFILQRLGLGGDEEVEVTLLEGAAKAFPVHVPSRVTPRILLTDSLDIRRTPGRPFLRMLADHAHDEAEKRRLLELCSSQGGAELTEFVRKAGLSVVDLLAAFPSAVPPLHRLIEMLPRLQPRPYTVASSRAVDGARVRCAFSEVGIPGGDGRAYARQGLATGFLRSLGLPAKIRVLFQEPKFFRLPSAAASADLLLVGPGTGVTPFLGFMRQLEVLDVRAAAPRTAKRHLFFGSRQLDLDGLYIEEMLGYESSGVLDKLHLVESQPRGKHEWSGRVSGVYVQDALRGEGKELAAWLRSPANPRIYVCGDAKSMSKDVFSALIEILHQHTDLSEDDARKFLMEKKSERSYVEDVWG